MRTSEGNPQTGPILRDVLNGKPLTLDMLASETIKPAILDPENYPSNAKRLTRHGYYAYRRGIATLANTVSRDPMAVKGLLRRSSVTTTLAHYIKDVPEVTKNAMTQVEALLTRLDGQSVQ